MSSINNLPTILTNSNEKYLLNDLSESTSLIDAIKIMVKDAVQSNPVTVQKHLQKAIELKSIWKQNEEELKSLSKCADDDRTNYESMNARTKSSNSIIFFIPNYLPCNYNNNFV